VFKRSKDDPRGITTEEIKLDKFILKSFELLKLLNKEKPFFKYLCDKDPSFFEILANSIDFSQTKIDIAYINEVRGVKFKLDSIFERFEEPYIRGNGKSVLRFSLQSLYIKLIKDNSITEAYIEKTIEDFKKVSPFYQTLMDMENEMQAGTDVLINK